MISRRQVAYHEAGHCVARWITFGEVAQVGIVTDSDGYEGYCGRAGVRRTMYRTESRERVITIMAGPLAQARHAHVSRDWVWLFGGGNSDRSEIIATLELFPLPYGTVAEEWPRFERQTTKLLRDHWDAVVRVAEGLDDRGKLSTREVAKILGPSDVAAHAATRWRRQRRWDTARARNVELSHG